MILERAKKHPLTLWLLPRFSARRALAAQVVRGLAGSFHAMRAGLAFTKKHGLRAACRRAVWHLRPQGCRGKNPWLAESPPEELLHDLLRELYPQGLPLISIVSVLYNKGAELPFFLKALFRQNYPGPYELILVNDASPDNGVAIAQKAYAELLALSPHAPFSLTIVENGANLGNCVSRNNGIARARGDILVVIDADCLINRSFLARHALALAQGPFDVGIGPCNMESGHGNPLQMLAKFEAAPEKALEAQKLQDPLCPSGFVNCVTRNFSIRRNKAPCPLFDPDFSYRASPDSGFGWEDVDMGYRIHRAGLRIIFIPGAFSIHISHHSMQGQDPDKSAKSLRNFAKLFAKHDDLALCAGRWAHKAYQGILGIEGKPVPADSPDRKTVEKAFKEAGLGLAGPGSGGPEAGGPGAAPLLRSGKPRLRILTYHWHTTHQYELFKLPHDFFLVKDIGPSFTGAWNYERRPQPHNAHFITAAKLREQDFDLAILPFDENVLAPGNSNGILPPDWGNSFRFFLQNVALPKIGICHGTPQFYGQYDPDYAGGDLLRVNEAERLRLVEATRDFLVVCNSHQALQEWGFASSQVIWHGMDPQEFRPGAGDAKGVLSLNAEAMKSRPFYNGYKLYGEIIKGLPKDMLPHPIAPASPGHCLGKENFYARAKFCNYVDELRKHLVYLNPTLRSPMPRTRTEAMLCGLISVSMQNHDVEMFIDNEKNGFFSQDPGLLRDYILYCRNNPGPARRIAELSRKTALSVFSLDRFLGCWNRLLADFY